MEVVLIGLLSPTRLLIGLLSPSKIFSRFLLRCYTYIYFTRRNYREVSKANVAQSANPAIIHAIFPFTASVKQSFPEGTLHHWVVKQKHGWKLLCRGSGSYCWCLTEYTAVSDVLHVCVIWMGKKLVALMV